MSSADLLEDGFPHSTPDGYRAGCQGHVCPGVVDNGISCADAFARFNGDYGYRKKVEAGMSPKEIIAAEQAAGVVAVPKPRPMVKPTAEPLPDDVQAELDDLLVDEQEVIPADVTPSKPERKHPGPKVKPLKHGTSYGYQRGCRDDSCPAPGGKTCRQAYRDYQNDYTARRRENGNPLGSIAGLPKGTRKRPHNEDPRDARLAELETLVAAWLAPGTGRHRAEVAS